MYKKLSFFLVLTSLSLFAGNKIPFVYHPGYNIRFFGLEKLHPFDTHKYGHIVERLKTKFGWKDTQFHKPSQPASDAYLKTFHSQEYIDSLNQSWTEFLCRTALVGMTFFALSQAMNIKAHPIKITMLGLWSIFYGISGLLPHQAKAFSQGLADNPSFYPLFMLLPGFLLRHCLLQPMKLAVNGTTLALEKALDPDGPGFCINLSGGYHHARGEGGGGFCYFNDTALALQEKIQKDKNFQALIIDCDFHCGDGNADFKSNYPDNITIIDMYGSRHYPFVGILKQRSDALEKHINYPNQIIGQNDFFSSKTNVIKKGEKNSSWYVDLLKQNLAKVSAKKFDCIIYNDGTDVYERDALGNFMDLSKDQIIERDATVFSWAFEHNIPIVQVLSGGYDKQMGAEIVADSAINIYENIAPKFKKN